METVSLQEMNKADLVNMINAINDSLGLAPGDSGYIKKSGNTDELLARLEEHQKLNEHDATPFSRVETERKVVKLSQLEINPKNFRHEADYFDEGLQHSLRMSGGFVGEFVVVHGGKKGKKDIYHPIGGNRTLYNLKIMLEAEGVDTEKYDIDILVRKYEGAHQEVEIQQAIEMFNDNERGLAHSVIDKLHVFQEMIKSGLTQTKIGEILGFSQVYISQTLKLSQLPDRILDLVHFEHHSEKFSQHASEYKEEMGMVVDAEGKVLGISLANAHLMTDLFPKRNDPDYKESSVKLAEFLSSEDVIEAAIHSNSTSFKSFLKLKMIEREVVGKKLEKGVDEEPGLIEAGEVQEVVQQDVELLEGKGESGSELQDSGGESFGEVVQPKRQTKRTKAETSASEEKGDQIVLEDGGNSFFDIGEDLASSKYTLAPTMEIMETLGSLLKGEDSEAIVAFRFLRDNNLLIKLG